MAEELSRLLDSVLQLSDRVRLLEEKLGERFVGHDTIAPAYAAPRGTLHWDTALRDLWANYDDTAPGWHLIGGGLVGPHNILDGGTVHLDSALDAVTQGSLIVGNSTPLWDELNHPGASDRLLRSDAADVSWHSTVLTIPAAGGITFGAGSGLNTITIPDNIASALNVVDDDSGAGGSPSYVVIESTDGAQDIRFFDTGGGKVGVNNNSPDLALHVTHQTAGAGGAPTWNTDRDIAVFEGQAGFDGYLHILTGTTRQGVLAFSDTAAGGRAQGIASYSHLQGWFRWATQGGSVWLDNQGMFGSGQASGVTVDRQIHSEVNDTTTNNVSYALRLTHQVTGVLVPVANFGIGMEWELEDSLNLSQIAAEDVVYWTTATSGTRSAVRTFDVTSNASTIEYLRLAGSTSQAESVFNEDQLDIDFRVESDAETHAYFMQASNGYSGFGENTPGTRLHSTETFTLTGNLGDGRASALAFEPGYTGAFTVTRHNYIFMQDNNLAGGAAVTNSAIIEFDAAIGGHSASTSSFTTTDSNSDTTNWAGGIIVNFNGTLYKIPVVAV